MLQQMLSLSVHVASVKVPKYLREASSHESYPLQRVKGGRWTSRTPFFFSGQSECQFSFDVCRSPGSELPAMPGAKSDSGLEGPPYLGPVIQPNQRLSEYNNPDSG